MNSINQQNQTGDNIGKNKYVINIGSTEIKVRHIAYLILFLLLLIFNKLFLSLMQFLFIRHFLLTTCFSLLYYFFIRKITKRVFYLLLLLPLLIFTGLYIDICPNGKSVYGINFLGVFSIDENGKIKKDDETDNLSSLSISKLKEKSKQHSSFTTKQYDLNKIDFPYFLIRILGTDGINRVLSLRQDEYNIMDFYYITNKNKITLNVIPNLDVYSLDTHIKWTATEISKLSTCLNFEDFNNLSSSLMVATLGQSCIQIVYSHDSNYVLAYSIANDSEKLISEVEIYASKCSTYDDFSKLIRLWKSNLYREKLKIALFQENYSEAVNYFCTAFNYSSTFPYPTYEKFKVEYTRSYYKRVGQIAIENSGSDSSIIKDIHTDAVSDDIGFLIDGFEDIPEEYIPSIYKSLLKNKKPSDPVYWLLLSKVIKYVPPTNPKEKRYRRIYLSQLNKSSQYLDSALVLDPNLRFAKGLKELYSLMLADFDSTKEGINLENMNSEHSEFFNEN